VGDGDVQGFREDKKFEIAHAAAADFNLGDAGMINVHSQAQDTICQFLLGESRLRPQPRLADMWADDVLVDSSE
jgi:hypothetical protein